MLTHTASSSESTERQYPVSFVTPGICRMQLSWSSKWNSLKCWRKEKKSAATCDMSWHVQQLVLSVSEVPWSPMSMDPNPVLFFRVPNSHGFGKRLWRGFSQSAAHLWILGPVAAVAWVSDLSDSITFLWYSATFHQVSSDISWSTASNSASQAR